MNHYAFDTGAFAAVFYCGFKLLGSNQTKQPVTLLHVVKMGYVLSQNIHQERRQRDSTVTSGSLWRRYMVGLIEFMIGFTYRQRTRFLIKIRQRERL